MDFFHDGYHIQCVCLWLDNLENYLSDHIQVHDIMCVSFVLNKVCVTMSAL